MEQADPHSSGILASRPGDGPAEPAAAGTHPLGLGRRRDGVFNVPAGATRPVPLLIMLHGAGASAQDVLPLVSAAAEEHSVAVLAPDSRGATWDVIQHAYGPDIDFLDAALARVFAQVSVDPRRIAVGGFSDGASYALSLGLANGDLVRDVLAFSPGFAAPARRKGAPRLFISHGRQDPVLPFERCGDRLATVLAQSGYDVAYHPFSGGHVVPTAIVEAAFRRFLA
ncbi:alpha/beta fold hydrolase [Methylobacterium sp. 17Sr1-1]|uniref:alpha/beta hydrolase n=1 Tax=Methylobacterium sp. 17Sr1-1 TaxID=2202826 RepID=UPI000D6F45B4|nr:alpha/beta fold hydrolase [Methylobacterium sp. 17Sr1-1]AWN50389.1 phospholipase [Methylobacterium sp. 17Sr1-1]